MVELSDLDRKAIMIALEFLQEAFDGRTTPTKPLIGKIHELRVETVGDEPLSSRLDIGELIGRIEGMG